MDFEKSSNPTMRDKYFNEAISDGTVMTINGAMVKTCILLFFVIFGASFGWKHAVDILVPALQAKDTLGIDAALGSIQSWMWVSSLISLGLAFITCMMPHVAMFTSIGYAIAEGVAIGSLSLCYAIQFRGVVATALLATAGITAAMFLLYKLNIVSVTEKFKSVVILSTFGVCFAGLAQLVCLFFFGTTVLSEGPIGIGLSLVFVVIASLNLLLDFDVIVKGAEAKAPKYMEWYAGFGLVVTIVWLYIELLRLISLFNKRN